MSTCHSLDPKHGSPSLPRFPPPEEQSLTHSWTGRRVVAIKERPLPQRRKRTATAELLQIVLRRSILNLPENPSQTPP